MVLTAVVGVLNLARRMRMCCPGNASLRPRFAARLDDFDQIEQRGHAVAMLS